MMNSMPTNFDSPFLAHLIVMIGPRSGRSGNATSPILHICLCARTDLLRRYSLASHNLHNRLAILRPQVSTLLSVGLEIAISCRHRRHSLGAPPDSRAIAAAQRNAQITQESPSRVRFAWWSLQDF